ncbi:hypothetical protein QM012_007325 [Aureobasidium pullulans]|uniref:BZIP domain-containing protein n=1 Tax=Aureobasidium pullulans TaxID=5580 RepID=A0ABR0TMM2_AURPU
MSEPSYPYEARSYPERIEDPEDEIGVLTFKNSGDANNTIDTIVANTNKMQNNKPTAHTNMKRKNPQNLLAGQERKARHADLHEKTTGNHEESTNDNPELLSHSQSLFDGPFKVNKDKMDEVINNLLHDTTTITTNLTSFPSLSLEPSSSSKTNPHDPLQNPHALSISRPQKKTPHHQTKTFRKDRRRIDYPLQQHFRSRFQEFDDQSLL